MMLSLFEMSVTGALLIAVIIILRAVLINRMPKKAFLVLWTAALARLLLPFRLSSPFSIYTAVKAVSRHAPDMPRQAVQTAAVRAARPLILEGGDPSGIAALLFPLPAAWLIGFLLMACFFLFTHLRGRKAYLASLPLENGFVKAYLDSHRLRRPVRARCCDQIGTPLTYGVLWPVIVLPKDIFREGEETLGYILAHELSHIRRFDTLAKWLYAAALCIHWFNPLAWAMYVLANRDLELACDEDVLSLYGPQSRSSYALSLVGIEEKRTCPTPLASSFTRQALKERIIAIMSSRPLTLGSIFAACALVITIVAVFATGAPSAGAPAGPSGEDGKELPAVTVSEAFLPPEAKDPVLLPKEPEYSGPDEDLPDYSEKEYTEEDYSRLVRALDIPGYRDMSIAEFNRRVNAALTGTQEEDNGLYEIFDEVLSSLPEDDPNAPYLFNTVLVSVREYGTRMDEVYSGKRIDHEYYGTVRLTSHGDVFGDPVSIGLCRADYSLTYRILDQDRLTVEERDEFLRQIALDAQGILEGLANKEEDLPEEAFKEALEAAGQKASTSEIEFTGCEIYYVELSRQR